MSDDVLAQYTTPVRDLVLHAAQYPALRDTLSGVHVPEEIRAPLSTDDMDRMMKIMPGASGQDAVARIIIGSISLHDRSDGLRAALEALVESPVDGDRVVRVTVTPIPRVGIGAMTATYVSQSALRALLRDTPGAETPRTGTPRTGTPRAGTNAAPPVVTQMMFTEDTSVVVDRSIQEEIVARVRAARQRGGY